MELLKEVVGFMAAVVGTALMLPQVIKTFRTRKIENISLMMLVLYFLNCLLWLMYGILIVAWPVILCNIVGLIISVIQLFLHYRFRRL